MSATEHRIAPQFMITTYQDHFQWPYRQRKELTLEDLTPPIKLSSVKQKKTGGTGDLETSDSIASQKKEKRLKFDNRNWKMDFAPDDPQWKINGWTAAENFWIRPLSERQLYVSTFGKIWEKLPTGHRK